MLKEKDKRVVQNIDISGKERKRRIESIFDAQCLLLMLLRLRMVRCDCGCGCRSHQPRGFLEGKFRLVTMLIHMAFLSYRFLHVFMRREGEGERSKPPRGTPLFEQQACTRLGLVLFFSSCGCVCIGSSLLFPDLCILNSTFVFKGGGDNNSPW
jgi:hypothetical protein